VYVSDLGNQTIRKVTPLGVVTTLAGLAGSAGSADGTNSAARFHAAWGVAVDSAGNLYVGDQDNGTIRKVTPVGTNWVVTTLAGLPGVRGYADGTNRAARFWDAGGVAVDTNGDLYVAEYGNCTIRKVTPVGTNWVVTTLAGQGGTDASGNPLHAGSADGTGSAAMFNRPCGMAMDNTGNLYVGDGLNNAIRKGFPASSVPAPLLQPPSLSAGRFGFGITGLPGLAVSIESSGNLTDWQVVGTCTLEGGTNSFVSPSPPQGAQFYRAQMR
jgi:secreted PhoX family phosphatase